MLTVKTVMSHFEYVKYSSLLNTLKGNCFDDEQYVYCMNSMVRKASLGLGLVSSGLVVLVLRTWSCSQHWQQYIWVGGCLLHF